MHSGFHESRVVHVLPLYIMLAQQIARLTITRTLATCIFASSEISPIHTYNQGEIASTETSNI